MQRKDAAIPLEDTKNTTRHEQLRRLFTHY